HQRELARRLVRWPWSCPVRGSRRRLTCGGKFRIVALLLLTLAAGLTGAAVAQNAPKIVMEEFMVPTKDAGAELPRGGRRPAGLIAFVGGSLGDLSQCGRCQKKMGGQSAAAAARRLSHLRILRAGTQLTGTASRLVARRSAWLDSFTVAGARATSKSGRLCGEST